MRRDSAAHPQADLEALSKTQLHALADALLLEEAQALERSVEFVLAETKGHWHGRARAMLCRRLKHRTLTGAQSARLVSCFSLRLTEGNFSEQFKDQLRLALHLNASHLFAAARTCNTNSTAHIRRAAQWVLGHEHNANEA
jgi:hypothetical protein